jgi:deoxyribodipyrimidine photo-lyase
MMSSVSRGLSTGASGKKNLNVHWFRLGDLRLHDNPALCQSAKAEGGILPVFCFDPRIFGNDARSKFGSLKCGPRRAKFILESVTNLRCQLEAKGSGLVVAHGKPESVFSNLFGDMDPRILCQEEVCSEELCVDKAIRSTLSSGSLQTVWGSTLYNLKDLPFPGEANGIPDVFTPFRNKVEKNCKIDMPMSVPHSLALPKDFEIPSMDKCSLSYMPTLEDLGYTQEQVKEAITIDPRGVMEFQGGETAALERVKYIAKECRRYEETRVANKSTYWVVFELLWRDFFKFFALKHGNAIFFREGTVGSNKRWGWDERYVRAWKEGRTGYPLVDANMRELAATGFMSNRGRQNVCSFLAIDMNQDWRYGADYFESVLLDYDVHSNWGNWCSGKYLM